MPQEIVNTVKLHVKLPAFFEVWQNRFLYFGVLGRNLGYAGSY